MLRNVKTNANVPDPPLDVNHISPDLREIWGTQFVVGRNSPRVCRVPNAPKKDGSLLIPKEPAGEMAKLAAHSSRPPHQIGWMANNVAYHKSPDLRVIWGEGVLLLLFLLLLLLLLLLLVGVCLPALPKTHSVRFVLPMSQTQCSVRRMFSCTHFKEAVFLHTIQVGRFPAHISSRLFSCTQFK